MLRRAVQEQPAQWKRRLTPAAGLVLAVAFVVTCWTGPLCADEPTHAELMVRPAIVEDGAAFDEDEAGRLLLKQSILERALEEGSSDAKLNELIGRHRARRLNRAQFMFDLHASHLGRDPRDDPRFEDARDAVFSAWKKIQRERLEEALGLEAWWDRKRARYKQSKADGGEGTEGISDRAWSLRVSPRFSSDSAGVKLRLKGTGSALLDGLTFRYSYETDESHPIFRLKFEDRMRLFDLHYAPDTPEFGDRVGFSVRYSW
ncbi:MAG: hypothetical protein AAGM22_18330 [Acidobacteriota bacterium]